MHGVFAFLAQLVSTLACTRYCHCQYCMVYGIRKGWPRGVVYCTIGVQ